MNSQCRTPVPPGSKLEFNAFQITRRPRHASHQLVSSALAPRTSRRNCRSRRRRRGQSGQRLTTAFGQASSAIINVHHHLVAPAYVKFLQENKVREFPVKGPAECMEDMDKAGVEIALCSTIGPGFWFGNLADTKRLAREINDYAAKQVSEASGTARHVHNASSSGHRRQPEGNRNTGLTRAES